MKMIENGPKQDIQPTLLSIRQKAEANFDTIKRIGQNLDELHMILDADILGLQNTEANNPPEKPEIKTRNIRFDTAKILDDTAAGLEGFAKGIQALRDKFVGQ